MGIGAFAGLLRKSKKHKSKSDGEDPSPDSERSAKEPLDDAVAGEEYSKVGRKAGDGPDSNPEIEDDSDEDDLGQGHDATAHAFTSFANHAGIPEEKRKKAHAALKMFVKSCTRSDD